MPGAIPGGSCAAAVERYAVSLSRVNPLYQREPASQSSECFSNAIRTSWLRVLTPVLSKSCCNTAFTELSEIDS